MYHPLGGKWEETIRYSSSNPYKNIWYYNIQSEYIYIHVKKNYKNKEKKYMYGEKKILDFLPWKIEKL